MGREIVRNDVNLLAARLADDQVGEEGHKLLAGVTRGGFAHHLAAAGVERGVKRKGAVAVVFKAMRNRDFTKKPPNSQCVAILHDVDEEALSRDEMELRSQRHLASLCPLSHLECPALVCTI